MLEDAIQTSIGFKYQKILTFKYFFYSHSCSGFHFLTLGEGCVCVDLEAGAESHMALV